MLNHDDGSAPAQSEQKIGRCACLLRGHSGGRLVQEQKLRANHQRHADLKPLLVAMRQFPRIQISSVGKPEQLDQFADARGALPRLNAAAGNFEIVAHGQTLEQARHLKLAHDTEPREVMDGSSDDVVAFEADGALRWPQRPGQHVEKRTLAGAVRSDYAAELAGAKRKADAAKHDDTAEAHLQIVRLEQWNVHVRIPLARTMTPRSRPTRSRRPSGNKKTIATKKRPMSSGHSLML